MKTTKPSDPMMRRGGSGASLASMSQRRMNGILKGTEEPMQTITQMPPGLMRKPRREATIMVTIIAMQQEQIISSR
jgi:hypothetical protein